MGFRFHNLNTIHRICVTRISSNASNLNHPKPVIQSSNFLLQDPCLIPSHNPVYSVPKRWHLGHSHHGHEVEDRRSVSGKESEKIFRLGLASDVVLAVGKALTGYVSGSTAIIADAAHSVSDVVLSGIALVSFKIANTPKDKEHPYGHGKFETLGALGISCMLLATAGGIAWHAFDLLLGLISADHQIVNQAVVQDHGHNRHGGGHHHGIDMKHPVLALTMTIVSISMKEGLYWITKRAGERQNSGLMIANAWHHRADAISSVVALIGVGGSILGVKFLDPFAGVVVSGMILKVGLETGYQSVMELVDAAIPSQQLDPVRETILKVEGVKACHRLRGRRAGSSLYLDVHIEVDPFCSVSTAHDIGENVRHQIHESHPEVAEIFIHIDPSISEISPGVMDQQENSTRTKREKSSVKDGDIEAAVSSIISSKFGESMVVERITRHSLRGTVLLQIDVSMPSDMMIRDAMEVAKRAEQEILKADPNIIYVSIQLRLGNPIPQFNHD